MKKDLSLASDILLAAGAVMVLASVGKWFNGDVSLVNDAAAFAALASSALLTIINRLVSL